MRNEFKTGARSTLLCLFALGLVTAFVIFSSQFVSEASQKGEGLLATTVNNDNGIPAMWDIRNERSDAFLDVIAKFRRSVGKDPSAVADIRDGFARGENQLKNRVPHSKVEYNNDIRIPEVITPDVMKERIEFLTSLSTLKRSEILRNFVKENAGLTGITTEQANALRVAADYTNPDGNISYAHLEQLINDVPVFRGEIKAGFTKDGRIIRVINNLAPGIDYESISSDFRDPSDAVRVAAGHINHQLRIEDTARNAAESTTNKVVFGKGEWPTTAERMYFPTEPGVAIPSWRVAIFTPTTGYYIIVDAADGVVLWHKNLSAAQSQTVTYQIYGSVPSHIDVADSPAPLSPYGQTTDPGSGHQGAIGTRSNRTLIGNEGTLSFNNLGWMNNNTNLTDGNAVEAGLDLVAPDGVDAPMPGDGPCPGAGCRIFTSTWNPPPGNPPPGDDPTTPQARRGGVIQMFYLLNRWHDEAYKRGFTEPAGNFQHLNFGRGGIEGDRVSAQGQDNTGTSGANMFVPADGQRPRLQMFIWTFSNPNRDGMADAEVVLHEMTHGLSSRLVGNTTGLGGLQAGMMSEGWSDWYAQTMLAESSDPINGVYAIGGYLTFNLRPGPPANYYYGLRRFPKAIIAFTGGPTNRPHNPLTFADIDPAQHSVVDGAYAPAFNGSATAVHDGSEVWSSMLWEVRALMVARRGFAAGTARALQVVTDGIKLTPLNPRMLQARDAMIVAAAALPLAPEASADVFDVREGFRRRGMGRSAANPSGNTVIEAYDVFPDSQSRADFDRDGRTDVSVFRPSNNTWYLNRSSDGFTAVTFGAAGDVLTPGDFDGDDKADISVWRPSNGTWYRLNSSNGTFTAIPFGTSGDVPVSGDYDGDNTDDVGVFRPSNGTWYRLNSAGGAFIAIAFGTNGDIPTNGDFDGDGKRDIAVFRPSNGTWYRLNSNGGAFVATVFGLSTDIVTPADYDGDNKDDVSVFRPSNGTWYRLNSGNGSFVAVPFGLNGDVAAPGDYDGDGRDDQAVFRNGTWYLNRSTAGFAAIPFGTAGDLAIPGEYLQ